MNIYFELDNNSVISTDEQVQILKRYVNGKYVFILSEFHRYLENNNLPKIHVNSPVNVSANEPLYVKEVIINM